MCLEIGIASGNFKFQQMCKCKHGRLQKVLNKINFPNDLNLLWQELHACKSLACHLHRLELGFGFGFGFKLDCLNGWRSPEYWHWGRQIELHVEVCMGLRWGSSHATSRARHSLVLNACTRGIVLEIIAEEFAKISWKVIAKYTSLEVSLRIAK